MRNRTVRRMRVLAVIGCVLASFVGGAIASEYPSKPIKIVSPFLAGGPTDTLARIAGQKLSERWGQPVIIENKPGAGGSIGADLVAKSPPDGYTLLLVANSHAINASIYSKLPYNTLADFTPIINVAAGPFVLAVHPSVAANTVQELIALAKANPGKLTYASAGIGTANHLAGELFKTMAGVDIVHVAYKGSPAATNDVLSGSVSMIFNNMISTMPLVTSKRIRALAVTSLERTPAVADLPTVAESGLPGFEVTGWYGILGPSGMPADVVRKLNGELNAIIGMADVQETFRTLGVTSVGGSAESFASFVDVEVRKWAQVVRASGARAD